jgi:hypothetical protein
MMPVSSAAAPLYVTPEQREVLETWSRSHAIPHRQVLRARIILLAGDGVANEVIAAHLDTSKPSVLKWRAASPRPAWTASTTPPAAVNVRSTGRSSSRR